MNPSGCATLSAAVARVSHSTFRMAWRESGSAGLQSGGGSRIVVAEDMGVRQSEIEQMDPLQDLKFEFDVGTKEVTKMNRNARQP
jgi:hypothetical protein